MTRNDVPRLTLADGSRSAALSCPSTAGAVERWYCVFPTIGPEIWEKRYVKECLAGKQP